MGHSLARLTSPALCAPLAPDVARPGQQLAGGRAGGSGQAGRLKQSFGQLFSRSFTVSAARRAQTNEMRAN